MFDASGRLKIIDFGCSRRAIGAAVEFGSVARGAIHWRSPELLAHADASNTSASDAWAAGLIMYEMATGRIAYSLPVRAQIGARHRVAHDLIDRIRAGRSPEELVALPPGLDPAFLSVMRSCLRLLDQPPGAPARTTAAAAFLELCAALPANEVRHRYGLPVAERDAAVAAAALGARASAAAETAAAVASEAADRAEAAGAADEQYAAVLAAEHCRVASDALARATREAAAAADASARSSAASAAAALYGSSSLAVRTAVDAAVEAAAQAAQSAVAAAQAVGVAQQARERAATAAQQARARADAAGPQAPLPLGVMRDDAATVVSVESSRKCSLLCHLLVLL
jgi:hypothetical protein